MRKVFWGRSNIHFSSKHYCMSILRCFGKKLCFLWPFQPDHFGAVLFIYIFVYISFHPMIFTYKKNSDTQISSNCFCKSTTELTIASLNCFKGDCRQRSFIFLMRCSSFFHSSIELMERKSHMANWIPAFSAISII